jgi:hypothetical protein
LYFGASARHLFTHRQSPVLVLNSRKIRRSLHAKQPTAWSCVATEPIHRNGQRVKRRHALIAGDAIMTVGADRAAFPAPKWEPQ